MNGENPTEVDVWTFFFCVGECGILVAQPGTGPTSLHWKCGRVLTTGPPAKSLLELVLETLPRRGRALKHRGLPGLPSFRAGPRMNNKRMRPGKQELGYKTSGK